MLNAHNITVSFGGTELFSGITFKLNGGDRIGLIGKNGAGKSTLLKIISNEQEYDSGTLAFEKDTTIGFLKQDIDFTYGKTILEEAYTAFTEIKKIDQYLPQLEWASLKNEGRVMDDQTLYAIQNDYLDAWYVKHVAFKTNTLTGINDYYTKTARKNIIKFIKQNNDKNISIVGTTLRHHPTLDFFSEDGKLAVITDKDVVEYKRIYQDETIVLENTEKSTFKIILLLEDGLWRIRHMIKEESVDNKNNFKPASINFNEIRGINYYPQDSPWDMFGDKYDTSIIEKDFKIIKN